MVGLGATPSVYSRVLTAAFFFQVVKSLLEQRVRGQRGHEHQPGCRTSRPIHNNSERVRSNRLWELVEMLEPLYERVQDVAGEYYLQAGSNRSVHVREHSLGLPSDDCIQFKGRYYRLAFQLVFYRVPQHPLEPSGTNHTPARRSIGRHA